jgi:hypothetical protein
MNMNLSQPLAAVALVIASLAHPVAAETPG